MRRVQAESLIDFFVGWPQIKDLLKSRLCIVESSVTKLIQQKWPDLNEKFCDNL